MILTNPNNQQLKEIAQELLARIYVNKKAILICGNGGSMAESQHLAGELVPLGFPSIALNDLSVITAIANDRSYELIFAEQIHAFKEITDTVICLTTSGKSKNIITAAYIANVHKLNTIVITGKSNLHSSTFHSDSNTQTLIEIEGDTHKIQERTLEFIHIIHKEALTYKKW